MKARGRPRKYRVVKIYPRINQFSPRGRPGRPDEIDLKMDEFEAVRLADLAGFSQKKAAESMNISQPTFNRIIKRAHKTIADAVVNGKIIRVQGGQYIVSSHTKSQEETKSQALKKSP